MKDISSILDKNVEELIDRASLEKKLQSGKKLIIKWGADPTRPDLHLGHVVVLDKLRQFQEAGHKVVFLIGDFTAVIGDPTGRSKTRPILTKAEIEKNAKTYFDQVGKVLDTKKIQIRKNSEWFNKFSLKDVIQLAAKFSLARIIERDDFEQRLKKGIEIRYHEGLYSMMQAYDSVELKADVEVGGSDQKYNLLTGRTLQKKMGQKPQDVMVMPLLVGTDGKKKMSKSLDNYIGVSELPDSIYGKIMSISDDMIYEYCRLTTTWEDFEIKEIKKELELGENPRNIKERLAIEIVKRFCGYKEALKAKEKFDLVFRQKQIPQDIPEVKMEKGKCEDLPSLLVELKLAKSKSDAKRLVIQGGVKIDEARIEDPAAPLCMHDEMIVQVGRRKFIKINLK